MKNSTTLYLILLLLFAGCGESGGDDTPEAPATCTIIAHQNASGGPLDPTTEIPELEAVYEDFETYVRESNTTGLSGIFLHNSMPLYITGKETSGIQSIAFEAPQFINNVRNINGLELRISNAEYSVYNGVATSWADFDEVIGGNASSSGVDLFLYIHTANGWKLASTTNTYTLTDDDTNYETAFPFTASPATTLENVVTAFNQGNRASFLGHFKGNSPMILLSGTFAESYSGATHNPAAFIDCAISAAADYELSVSNVETEVRDQFLAKVTAQYTISTGGSAVESGTLVMTMIGTPNGGWDIAGTVFTY